MNITQEKYINQFNSTGLVMLNQYGFDVSVKQENESVNFHISRAEQKYLLTFSTHHLDYDHGVIICESKDGKLHWDKIRLPNGINLSSGNIYNFMGDNISSEIIRIIQDFLKYIQHKTQLGGEPFDYCSQSGTDHYLSCDVMNLIKLGEHNTDRNTKENFHKCTKCSGYWKSSLDQYNREIWLKIGEISDQKYLTVNQNDYHDKQWTSFPLTFFNVSEAISYGLKYDCGRLSKIDNYHGMSCDPLNLSKVKSISEVEAIGNSLTIDIFKCTVCATQYEIKEEFDSHHGVNKVCVKQK
jgi:hypothetical protein